MMKYYALGITFLPDSCATHDNGNDIQLYQLWPIAMVTLQGRFTTF